MGGTFLFAGGKVGAFILFLLSLGRLNWMSEVPKQDEDVGDAVIIEWSSCSSFKRISCCLLWTSIPLLVSVCRLSFSFIKTSVLEDFDEMFLGGEVWRSGACVIVLLKPGSSYGLATLMSFFRFSSS